MHQEILHRILQDTQPQPQNYQIPVDPGPIHYKTMTIIWLTVAVLGIWSQAFKQYPWSIYVHFCCMTVLTVVSWMGGFLAIVAYGVSGTQIGDFHVGLGIGVLVVLVGQCVGGMVAWVMRRNAGVNPKTLHTVNFVHKVLGWALIILALIQLLTQSRQDQTWIFISTLIVFFVSYIPYLLLKLLRPRMPKNTQIQQQSPPQSHSQSQSQSQTEIPIIKTTRELAKYGQDYFIFADRVYEIGTLMGNHPGGYEIVKVVRGREVDRFLYGVQALEEFVDIGVHTHTASSITLAGPPIAYLQNPSPYTSLPPLSTTTIHHTTTPFKNKQIFLIYLHPSQPTHPTHPTQPPQKFTYEGYSSLSQLGKYYTVTIDDRITRLYSVVNFVHEDNVEIMERIFGRGFQGEEVGVGGKGKGTLGDLVEGGLMREGKEVSTIPLIIKRYDQGKFTSQFLSGTYTKQIKLSKPRGRGLGLDELPPGHLIFFSGGTGINPYCDLIDLLYKQHLLSQPHKFSSQLLQKNPILTTQKISQNFTFTFYISVNSLEDVHELTLWQLNQLCKFGKIRVFVRGKNIGENVFGCFRKIQENFGKVGAGLGGDGLKGISGIFVCGPVSMNRAMVESFREANIPSSKYRIL